MSETETITHEQQALADQLDRNIKAMQQSVADSMTMDRAYLTGTLDQWMKDYCQREVKKFLEMPLPTDGP